MFIIKERYPLYYFQGDYSDLVPVPHETFFEEKDGQIYSQFYPGQLIPREIFNRIFGTTEVENPIEIEEVPVDEVSITEEVAEVIETKVEADTIVEVVEVQVEQPTEEVSQPKAKVKKKK